jgi:hypothetical protein
MSILDRAFVSLLFVSLLALPAAAQTDEELAMRFYPQRLDQIFIENHSPETELTRNVRTLRVDLDRTGRTDYVAAVYSNGMAAELKVIKDGAVVAAGNDPTMGGKGRPTLDVVDIDNDGVPELVVGFWRASWIYKYRNASLALFGPSRAGTSGVTSNLGNATYLDLDGDGVLEILEQTEGDSDVGYIVHKLDSGGTFVPTSQGVVFTDRFDRAQGQPVLEERWFAAKAGDYILRISNGDQAKNSVVTAGEVRLNGRVLIGNAELKKGQRTLSIPVKLLESNALAVELRSDPDSFFYVSFLTK